MIGKGGMEVLLCFKVFPIIFRTSQNYFSHIYFSFQSSTWLIEFFLANVYRCEEEKGFNSYFGT